MDHQRNWRRAAKDVLYGYWHDRKLLADSERAVLNASRGGIAEQRAAQGRHGDPTGKKALLLCSGEMQRLRQRITAVDDYLATLDRRRRDQDKLYQLIWLVYFRASHTQYGAAALLGISERTAKRWNDRALRAIAVNMGWLDSPAR
ncbi:MAG: hypothetical protein Q4B96_04290 [Bacillota bacterium]|nr:hypothetical protein [Bacillota bacterium]